MVNHTLKHGITKVVMAAIITAISLKISGFSTRATGPSATTLHIIQPITLSTEGKGQAGPWGSEFRATARLSKGGRVVNHGSDIERAYGLLHKPLS